MTIGSCRAHVFKDSNLNEPRRKLLRTRFFATDAVHIPVTIRNFGPTPSGARQYQAVHGVIFSLVFFLRAFIAVAAALLYLLFFRTKNPNTRFFALKILERGRNAH